MGQICGRTTEHIISSPPLAICSPPQQLNENASRIDFRDSGFFVHVLIKVSVHKQTRMGGRPKSSGLHTNVLPCGRYNTNCITRTVPRTIIESRRCLTVVCVCVHEWACERLVHHENAHSCALSSSYARANNNNSQAMAVVVVAESV